MTKSISHFESELLKISAGRANLICLMLRLIIMVL